MKRIINPVKWMARKADLDKQIALAIKHHRPRADLLAERRNIMTGLIAYANRRDDEEVAA